MSSVKSPCILVCSIDLKTGYCFGCGRTSREISGWMNYSDRQRDEIMQTLDSRMSTIERKPRRVTKRQRMRQSKQSETN